MGQLLRELLHRVAARHLELSLGGAGVKGAQVVEPPRAVTPDKVLVQPEGPRLRLLRTVGQGEDLRLLVPRHHLVQRGERLGGTRLQAAHHPFAQLHLVGVRMRIRMKMRCGLG